MARTGLNVPIITVLDNAGEIIEADQRRVIRHVIQDGSGGADSLFLSGTTGEFDKITKRQRQRILEIGCEEVHAFNQRLRRGLAPVEAWAGVTAPSVAETLENLELAVQLEADMAVVAPMAINNLGIDQIEPFFKREIAPLLDSASLTIALYDNPDIASRSAAARHIPLRIVEKLNELPFVVCLKASTSRDVLQDHLRVSLTSSAPDPFKIYVGNAPLILEYEEIQRAAGVRGGRLALAGVVSGPANLLPREWRAAWQAVVDRDAEQLARYGKAFSRFDEICSFGRGTQRAPKGVAAIKRAMFTRGVISSPRVAPRTPALTDDEARRFDADFDDFLEDLKGSVGCPSLSVCSV